MRLRSHRRNLVVWSSSADWSGAQRFTRVARTRRMRRWARTGALLTVIGLIRVARTMRTRWRVMLGLAGAVLTVAGVMLPSAAVLLPGLLVFLVALLIPLYSDTAFVYSAEWPRPWAAPCTPISREEPTAR
jgi:hypothetical protein